MGCRGHGPRHGCCGLPWAWAEAAGRSDGLARSLKAGGDFKVGVVGGGMFAGGRQKRSCFIHGCYWCGVDSPLMMCEVSLVFNKTVVLASPDAFFLGGDDVNRWVALVLPILVKGENVK